ncbi:MAG: PQQ-binding-like beta-propeller repeat protein [Candidatus Omnitrophica bacterium]|nr:PQQ-binding-like beta-propeller repeat protein [Candidatus Omnitrophota bacterium]
MKQFLNILLISIFLAWPVWSDDSVPTFHNDNQRTGRTDQIGPAQPQLLWAFKAKASFTASPVIGDDGVIYAASTDKNLYAINPDGSQKWAFEAEESIFGTPAIAPDGSILFGDLNGRYYAVNPDGTQKWLYRFLSGSERRIVSAPVVDGSGQSYIGAWNKEIHAIDPDGLYRWKTTLGGFHSCSPVLDQEENIYIVEQGGGSWGGANTLYIHKFAPNSSAKKWTWQQRLDISNNRVISNPAIDAERGHIILAACQEMSGIVYAVRLSDHTTKWQVNLPKGVLSSPAIGHDGTVYVGCLGGAETGEDNSLEKQEFGLLYAFDPEAGDEKWTFQTDGYFIFGSPCVDGNGVIYIGDSDGVLYALNPAGEELWRFAAEANIASAPVIGKNGVLYFTSYDSNLYAVSNPTALYRWREF